MKKILTAGILFISALTFAQDKIEVTYTTRIILPEGFEFQSPGGGRQMPKEMQDDFKKSIQEPQESTLTIFGDQSNYKAIEKISNDQESSMGRNHMRFMRFGGDNIYKDIATSTYFKDANVSTKEYTVKDELPKLDWKLTRETKTILGNEARKATLEKDGQTITAWYTTKIPAKTGPENYWGLPGLILEIDSTLDQGFVKGRRLITMSSIKTLNNNKPIEAPKVKNTITEAELDKLQKEQRSRFEQMRDQGVNRKD